MKSKDRYMKIWKAILIAFLIASAITLPGKSQGGVGKIEIISVNSEKFPDIVVQSRILDQSGQPITTLNPADFVLSENDQPVEFTHRSVEAGNKIVFVIDCGGGADSPGMTGASRIEEMKSIASRYINGLTQDDRVMLIQQVGIDTKILQGFTSDKAALETAVTNLSLPAHMTLSYGLNGLQKALDELKADPGERKGQSIVFLSTGIQNTVATTTSKVVIQYAKDLTIPIYSVLSHDAMPTSLADVIVPIMQSLATETGGTYTYFKNKTDIDPLFERLNTQRIQYQFTFRSKLNNSSDRTIQLATSAKGNDAPRGFAKYTVTIQAPHIIIESPAGGQQFIREAQQYMTDLTGVEPTSASVAARVEWPDSHPRRIASAEFLVDNATSGTPLVEPGDTLNFNWDLRSYQTPGETPAQLRIRVKDELGIEAISDPLTASVVVTVPPPPAAAGRCDGLSGYELLVCRGTNLSGWFALGLAVPTLLLAVLAYRKKETIVEGVKSVGNFADQAWKRITQGPVNTRAAAYLQVLSEAHKPVLGNSIPLYKGAPITIGRDPSTNRIPIMETRQDTVISREHCTIQEKDGAWFIKDMDSTYGTFRDSVQLPKMTEEPLNDGDEIWLGPLSYGGVRLMFRVAAADGMLPEAVEENRITR